MMTRNTPGFVIVLAMAVVAGAASLYSQQEKGGDLATGPYDVVPGWPDNPCSEGYTFGSTGGIFAESPDRVLIFQRGCLPELPADDDSVGELTSLVPSRNASGYSWSAEDPSRHPRREAIVYIVNREGAVIGNWDQHNDLFVRPHKVKISPYDPERHIWIVEDGGHQVHKFTNDGELVMSIGEFEVPGNDDSHFDRPTDIAWLPDGTFFISDGYDGVRVAKFDPEGNFIKDWGQAPADPDNPGPNEWDTVHSIAISADRRVFVVDRGHHRMQVFDEEGEFLDMFVLGMRSSPYYHMITEDQALWVSDGGTDRILKYDLNGYYQYGWGGPGTGWGQFEGPHQMSVDQDGNLYVAEVFNGRVQKFVPRPGADPAKMVGQEVRYQGASSR